MLRPRPGGSIPMTIHTTGSLIDTLRTFRLISAEQYKELFTQIHSKGGDPRPLAKQLVQRGWLTVYQINQLFAGRRKFLQEVDAMTRLDHPNIVQFCDADHHDDTCYFAMEYIDGIDLGKHVKLGGPGPVREACEFIRQAA